MKKSGRVWLICALLFAMLFSLWGCGDKYPQKKQTALEAEKILTLDGEIAVTYDLYRFAFLSYLERTPDEGSEKERFAAADDAAKEEIFGLYAVFTLCRQYGIDPFSQEVDKEISAAVKELIEGENGFGKYADYLAALQSSYMTDAVYRLYVRQEICEEKLAEKIKEQKVIPAEDEDILAFFADSEKSARAMWCYLSPEAVYNAPGVVDTLYKRAMAAEDSEFSDLALVYQDGQLNTAAAMKKGGAYVGLSQWSAEFRVLEETVFSLKEGETSAPVKNDYWREKNTYGIYIVRRVNMGEISLEKEEDREELTECYMLSMFGGMLRDEAVRLAGAATYTDFYRTLTLSTLQAGK